MKLSRPCEIPAQVTTGSSPISVARSGEDEATFTFPDGKQYACGLAHVIVGWKPTLHDLQALTPAVELLSRSNGEEWVSRIYFDTREGLMREMIVGSGRMPIDTLTDRSMDYPCEMPA